MGVTLHFEHYNGTVLKNVSYILYIQYMLHSHTVPLFSFAYSYVIQAFILKSAFHAFLSISFSPKHPCLNQKQLSIVHYGLLFASCVLSVSVLSSTDGR